MGKKLTTSAGKMHYFATTNMCIWKIKLKIQNYTDFSVTKAKLLSITTFSLIFTATNNHPGVNHPKQEVNSMLSGMELAREEREENQLHGSISRSQGAETKTNEGKVDAAEQCTAATRGCAEEPESLTHQEQERTQDKQHLREGGDTPDRLAPL